MISRNAVVFICLVAVFRAGGVVTAQETPNKGISIPQSLVLAGPNGASLRFTHPVMGLYRNAEVLLPGKPAVPISFGKGEPHTTVLVDGAEAETDNFAFAGRLTKNTPWSLNLWSSNGDYIVLTTYLMLNGRVDLRNNRFFNAYSTHSGQLIHFKGPSGSLAGGGFLKWSPTKPETALLEGRNGVEQAVPNH